jgi:hypothetical protein
MNHARVLLAIFGHPFGTAVGKGATLRNGFLEKKDCLFLTATYAPPRVADGPKAFGVLQVKRESSLVKLRQARSSSVKQFPGKKDCLFFLPRRSP